MKESLSRSRVYLRALERVSKLHIEISCGRFPSVSQLARHVEVTERTIKRDITFLRDELGAPLLYDRKRRGFTYAEPGWTMPPVKFSEGDILAFFIAENALRLSGQTPEALRIRGALAKLAALLPDQVSISIAALGESVSFANAAFESSEPETLQLLASAAASCITVEFDYYAQYRQQTERRRVDPYLLHNFSGDWYAISYDHERGAMRDFHVGRISNLALTNDPFTINRRIWNKDDYLAKGFQMMRGGRLTSVSILFDQYQAQWIRSRQAFHPQEIKETLADGSLRLSFKIGQNALEAVARFCLTYAGHCVAEKPKKLRRIVRERLEAGLELNSAETVND